MGKHGKTPAPPPDKPGRPEDWREQIEADLAAQLEAGGTLYGFRPGRHLVRADQGRRPGHQAARSKLRLTKRAGASSNADALRRRRPQWVKSTLTRTAWFAGLEVVDPDAIARGMSPGRGARRGGAQGAPAAAVARPALTDVRARRQGLALRARSRSGGVSAARRAVPGDSAMLGRPESLRSERATCERLGPEQGGRPYCNRDGCPPPHGGHGPSEKPG